MRDGAIYLHAMFRTGSTYLAARFAADPGFRLFYEPFHGDIALPRRLARAAADYEARRRALGHDAISRSNGGTNYARGGARTDELAGLWRSAARYEPALPAEDAERLLSEWRVAVRRALLLR